MKSSFEDFSEDFENEEDYCDYLRRSQKIQQLAWLLSCPPEIRQRKALELADLIEQLADLEYLMLPLDRGLTELPPEIGQLVNLQHLELRTASTEIPPGIGKLVNLKTLNLKFSKLTELPSEIGQLVNLQELRLFSTQLTKLPPEIGQLVNLRELDLSNTLIEELPPEIGQLINLRYLYLRSNNLTKLPPEIGQLINLRHLFLGGSNLMKLPPEIAQLTSLTSLNLRKYQLTKLPPEIAQLTSLTYLNLDENPITNLSALANHPNWQLRVRAFGIELPRRYWTHVRQWQPAWLLNERNAEVRRVLIQHIGYDRICQELQAIELNSWREYTLLKIAADVDVEPIHLLKMTCPSTAHIHVLRVPPDLTSARDAIRWTNWDVDPEAFAVET